MAQSKSTPFLVGIPNVGVGLLWAMNMNLVPLLVSQFTPEKQKIGWLTSMGAVTGMFVQYLAGILSDRSHFKIGRRKPFILGGSLVATVFLCLMPFSPSYWTLFICGFLFYFFLNFYQGPYYSMIPEVVDHSQLGVANGYAKIIGVVGAGIIFVAGPKLWAINPAYPFFLGAALSLVSVLITFFAIKEDPDRAHAPRRIAFDFYRYPSVVKLFAAIFFVFLSLGSITPYFVMFCQEHLQLTADVASTALLSLTLAGAVFAYPIGLMADRRGHRRVFLFGAILFTLGLLVAVFLPPLPATWLLFLAMGIVGVGYIGLQITSFALLAEIVPRARLGEFMGLMNLFISLPQFLGSIVMGPIIDSFGYRFYLPIAAGIMFIAAVLAAVFRFKKDFEDPSVGDSLLSPEA